MGGPRNCPQSPMSRTRPGEPGARLSFQFATVTTRTAKPVPPAESRTLIVTEWLPFGVPFVVHGIEIGPFDVVFVVPTAVPSTLIVNVFVPAAAFSIQIVNHAVPRTVAPSAPGCVMKTLIVDGGGCFTVMLRTADAAPALSCTVRFSVCGPSGTLLEFQLNDAVVAVPEIVKTWLPSTVSVNTIGVPVAPVSDMPTVTLPLTVAPSAGLVKDATSC